MVMGEFRAYLVGVAIGLLIGLWSGAVVAWLMIFGVPLAWWIAVRS